MTGLPLLISGTAIYCEVCVQRSNADAGSTGHEYVRVRPEQDQQLHATELSYECIDARLVTTAVRSTTPRYDFHEQIPSTPGETDFCLQKLRLCIVAWWLLRHPCCLFPQAAL
ncbi:hypothetical protein TEQG_03266 [Trichophyton equinum CBS 127.97]|uniref:Uncharacterized protein n=1 Tax=Trichophyton equinum (strain ATCC MYA-4606 / CBS 127.97) TaxID=559882 RepID=F2PQR8_TRIEC|nr:hypothetical protein TEQG_03266 [Trichophyton equinum CBS 127.97]